MPQSAIARGLLAQFSASRQADESGSFSAISAIERALEKQRDRLPVLAPVGLGTGILIWQSAGTPFLPAFACAIAGLVLIAIWGGLHRRLFRLLLWGALLSGLGFSVIAVKAGLRSSPALDAPRIVTFNGRIASVEDVSARAMVRYRIVPGATEGLPDMVRVNVPLQHHRPEFQPGAIVRLKARLMPPPGPALPRGYDFARQAWFTGIGATGSALGPIALLAPAQAGSDFWSQSREDLARHIRQAMSADTGGIGAALLVGTRGAISEADAEALRNSGMAHLLSVSGLHVSAVVGAAFLLVSRLLSLFSAIALRFPVPIISAAASALVAVCYTLLTGAEVPTVRACIAALLVLLALVLGREALSMRLLAAGAFLVLLFWPESLAGPSFQLSFAAVATIIALHESRWLQKWLGRREEPIMFRLLRMLVSLLVMGAAIELVLAPIALFHFHKSGLYGALANIVAIPLTTFFVMPMQILGLLFDLADLGTPFWWLAGQGVSAIIALAYMVGNAPGSVLALPAMPQWAFGLMVAGGIWLAVLHGPIRMGGLLPIAAGVVAAAMAPYPDILVTSDGRHVGVINASGELVLLRPNAGDYAVSMLSENSAVATPPVAMDSWPDARCSADICSFSVKTGDRNWVVMATRSSYLVPTLELAAACRRSDIVISERFLPKSCTPRWFKADRSFLDQQGGLALYLDAPRVETVAQTVGNQPWSTFGARKRAPKRPDQKAAPAGNQ